MQGKSKQVGPSTQRFWHFATQGDSFQHTGRQPSASAVESLCATRGCMSLCVCRALPHSIPMCCCMHRAKIYPSFVRKAAVLLAQWHGSSSCMARVQLRPRNGGCWTSSNSARQGCVRPYVGARAWRLIRSCLSSECDSASLP